MKASVLLVGDELLAGHTRDANAHFLAKRITELGHRMRRVLLVPDELRLIAEGLDYLLASSDIVFISGGLGPTHDDRTTEALAVRFNRRLVVDEPSWNKLVERYGHRMDITDEMRESARKMVTIPEGSEPLDNPVGAAPGYLLHEGGISIVVLPGVPAELQAIFEQRIVGRHLPRGEGMDLLEVDVAMPEAAFAHALGDVAQRFADLEIGSYPHFGEKRVTLRFRGEPARAQEALEAFLEACPDVRERILKR